MNEQFRKEYLKMIVVLLSQQSFGIINRDSVFAVACNKQEALFLTKMTANIFGVRCVWKHKNEVRICGIRVLFGEHEQNFLGVGIDYFLNRDIKKYRSLHWSITPTVISRGGTHVLVPETLTYEGK